MNPKRIDPFLAQRLAERRARTDATPGVTTRGAAPTPASSPTPSPTPPAPLEVFIRTRRPLTTEELGTLQSFIGPDAPSGRTTYTATLTPEAIESLSDLDWIFRISGSQTLRPLDPPAES